MNATSTRILMIAATLVMTVGLLTACGESESTSGVTNAAPTVETAQQEIDRADRQHESFRADDDKPRESHSATVPAR